MQAWAVLVGLLWAPAALAQDSDGDLVHDAVDAFPCDATAAAVAFAPAEGAHGALLFEDQWPAQGDFDFNDAVIGWSYAARLDAQGRTVSLRATFDPLALGGDFDNGLGLHLPIPRGAVATVTRRVEGAPDALVTPSRTDTELTVVVADDLRALLGGTPGPLNARLGQPVVAGAVVELDIVLSTPTAVNFGLAPFDVFLFRAQDPSLEVHLPDYGGTAAFDATRLNTAGDASGGGRHFVAASGVPFGLVVPDAGRYPAEGVDIAVAFPRVLGWAASGGLQDRDFYAAGVNDAATYTSAPAPAFLAAPGFSPDTSCVGPALPTYSGGACPALGNGGNNLVTSGAPRYLELRLPPNPQGAPVVFVHPWMGLPPGDIIDWLGLTGLEQQGVVLVAPSIDPNGPGNWRFRDAPAGNPDLVFFDDLLACLHQQFAVDPDRIYATGMSVGGMWTTYLGMHRSQYLAAIAPFSGGMMDPNYSPETIPNTYVTAERRIPVLQTWGGPSDQYFGPTPAAAVGYPMDRTDFWFDFHGTNVAYLAALRGDGHYVVRCEGTFGHSIPWEVNQAPNFIWTFFSAHIGGNPVSPWASAGLPASMPAYCTLP